MTLPTLRFLKTLPLRFALWQHWFQLESGGSFDAQEVLYVLGLKKNLLSISLVETKVMRLTSRGGKCSFAQREPVHTLL
jgi:hypothetical protein